LKLGDQIIQGKSKNPIELYFLEENKKVHLLDDLNVDKLFENETLIMMNEKQEKKLSFIQLFCKS